MTMSTDQPNQVGASASDSKSSQPDAVVLAFINRNNTCCPSCGYNMRGLTSPVCPECGQIISLRLRRRFRGMWSFAAALFPAQAVVFLFLLPASIIALLPTVHLSHFLWHTLLIGGLSLIAMAVLIYNGPKLVEQRWPVQVGTVVAFWVSHAALVFLVLFIEG